MNRHSFLRTGFLSAAGLAVASSARAQESPAPLKTELVKEFVIAGHGNIAKVKELLVHNPNLIYSRYDWGNGDFEEAIEGSAHVGNKELANLLIENGARINLFVLAMLGKTELVIPILDQFPNLIQAKGAHGFTLLHHAKVGGNGSEQIFQYLTEKGLKETQINIR
jgi:hypothetical protein